MQVAQLVVDDEPHGAGWRVPPFSELGPARPRGEDMSADAGRGRGEGGPTYSRMRCPLWRGSADGRKGMSPPRALTPRCGRRPIGVRRARASSSRRPVRLQRGPEAEVISPSNVNEAPMYSTDTTTRTTPVLSPDIARVIDRYRTCE
jgi:hypothetical protein